MLTHHNKKKREFAGDQNFVMVVLFRPVVSYAGVIMVTATVIKCCYGRTDGNDWDTRK